MKVDILLGLQWGDEGKGKIVDVLTPHYDIIARFQGGPNAGHTLEFDGEKHVLHTIPSGIFHDNIINIIGNGVIIDPVIFEKEALKIKAKNIRIEDNLLISKKAHLILPSHRLLDAVYEFIKDKSKIGSTLKGIGPTYSDKTGRNGIRVGDILLDDFRKRYDHLKKCHMDIINHSKFDVDKYLIDGFGFKEYEEKWFESVKKLAKFRIIDSEYYINNAIKNKKRILAEGAQGTMLDIDFGSYPFVTSSNTISAGACTGLGVSPDKIGKVMGVFKAYCTRVGSGPFPTELSDEKGELMRNEGHEFGSTTGRPRRCGWLDMVALKYSIMLNGTTHLIMTKADVLTPFDKINICNSYEMDNKTIDYLPFEISCKKIKPVYKEYKGWKTRLTELKSIDRLPQELMQYVDIIEKETELPVSIISVGPDRNQTLIKNEIF